MFVAKELTPTSWIVYNRHNLKEGILSKHSGGYTYIGNDIVDFGNKDAMLEFFGSDMKFEDRVVTETEEVLLNEFPIDTNDLFDVDDNDVQPSYVKRAGSKIRHYAGFWGIKFSHGYALAFCPKVATTEKYESIGPFKDKLFAQQEIRLLNSR